MRRIVPKCGRFPDNEAVQWMVMRWMTSSACFSGIGLWYTLQRYLTRRNSSSSSHWKHTHTITSCSVFPSMLKTNDSELLRPCAQTPAGQSASNKYVVYVRLWLWMKQPTWRMQPAGLIGPTNGWSASLVLLTCCSSIWQHRSYTRWLIVHVRVIQVVTVVAEKLFK